MQKNIQGGFVSYIAIFIISVALLGYFSVDVKGYLDKCISPGV